MIIFIGEGGLGNQIYQYAFIKNFLKPNELLITFNFKNFKKLFHYKDRILNIENRYIYVISRVVFRKVFDLLSKIRVISSARAKRDVINGFSVEGSSYIYTKGLFPTIYIYPGYFQSENFFKKESLKYLKIKDQYIKRAKEVIKNLPKGLNICFIHVRRGDYKDEVVLGIKDITLPIDYYRKGIKELTKSLKSIYFIFLSNDRDFIMKNFKDIKNKHISDEIDVVDFTIMTLCNGGIISNSSFSWWGAYFGNRRNIIAPKYWYGFKSEEEIPIGVSPSFAKIIEFDKYGKS